MSAAESPDGTAQPPRRPRHRVRATFIVLTGLAVAAAGAFAATGAMGGDGKEPQTAAPTGPGRTVEVEKTTLTRTQTVDGTLGYGNAMSVQARGGTGTLTSLPMIGDVIGRGDSVYSVDQNKVPLIYGSIPPYRTLESGSEGDDVEQLEENLAALGYTGFTVDQDYTWYTAYAVEAWQDDLGLTETGKIAPDDIVLAPGERRVDEVKATLGSPPSGEVLTLTETDRLISVDLETKYEDLAQEGTKATVTLPDATNVDAEVTSVGNAVEASGSSGEETMTVPIELSVKNQKKLGRYQAAPVDVTLTSETRENVLAVPINALVAKKDGGYAVQAVTASGTEYVTVKVGLFSNGMVEISGDGITEGLKVGIPQ